MSNRYAPLPNNPNAVQDVSDELEAAFDESNDEDNLTELHPLNPMPNRGTYDFEADYDYPPPGSPPDPSAIALPNNIGNSNGITTFTVDSSALGQRRGWFGRTIASVLPTHYARRLGFSGQVPSGAVGSGSNMDGVFANVTAKPSRPIRVQDGDDSYLVPEHSQSDALPSYASAQADSVPTYWETTVHAPFSGDTMGEVVIDSLPTGTLFSFLWNMLVSMSFQFVGFLLTYLLHTTHAARLGSRAGLGFTLIQYGFSLRNRLDSVKDSIGEGNNWPGFSAGEPTSETEYFWPPAANATAPSSMPGGTIEGGGSTTYLNSAGITTTEWLSFFLMTIGWFILLTSLLGFWRVKRWERGVLSPQPPAAPQTPEETARQRVTIYNLERIFGIPILSRGDLRRGLGLGSRDPENEYVVHETDAAGRRDGGERERMLAAEEGRLDGNHDISERDQRTIDNESRLQADHQAAGLL